MQYKEEVSKLLQAARDGDKRSIKIVGGAALALLLIVGFFLGNALLALSLLRWGEPDLRLHPGRHQGERF